MHNFRFLHSLGAHRGRSTPFAFLPPSTHRTAYRHRARGIETSGGNLQFCTPFKKLPLLPIHQSTALLAWRLIIHALDAALRCPPERRPRRRGAHVERVAIPRPRRRRDRRLRSRRAFSERVPRVRRPLELLVALLWRGGRDGVVRRGARAAVRVAVRAVLAT